MLIMQRIKKYYEYGITKLRVLKEQKQFRYKDVRLKYMYKTFKGADTLAVVFGACTRIGLPARYNYVKTLDGVHCNRLYILDDFCEDRRGSFLLGHYPQFDEQGATLELIDKVIRDTKPKRVLFCGSCKGAYIALNIGTRYKDSVMIVGEPPYRIATEWGLDPKRLEYWEGTVTEENNAAIDRYLEQQLISNEYKDTQKIEMFYSNKDEYYEKHTLPILECLHEQHYQMEEQTAEFEQHGDLALYFPEYLKTHVKQYLN